MMNSSSAATLQDFYAFAQRKNKSIMYLFAGRVRLLPDNEGRHTAMFNKPPESILKKEIVTEMEQIFNEYWRKSPIG
jgi:hypothetical protein